MPKNCDVRCMMKWGVRLWAVLFGGLVMMQTAEAQEKLYENAFPMQDVQLLDGPFKHARDLNIQTLLAYDVDRLLAPFLKEAGLEIKAPLYPNWAGLDGHVGGHYLTAMAMNYASTGNKECLRRMEYMIAELKRCQEASTIAYPDWGKGYIGGVPNSKKVWSDLKKGDFGAYRASWVPWYNVHKLYAGLRDAWAYTGNEEAKALFLKLCDWAIDITSALSDEQMQAMLATEHGGMNETLADAWKISGNEKYLVAAKRFSHNTILDAMANHTDNLDNVHANTQVPKAVGFQRIAEITKDKKYVEAGRFFWETVSQNRSIAIGGNSRREFFPSAAACSDYVTDVEGPETCNTYNMLKLTEGLFRSDPSERYTAFYEKAMFNHILSTQHPEHGGYVYFTPARPRHYRVYSAPNQGMWCCVGSGMENHAKYNQFIYTHRQDSLYLNLFVASELNWKDKGITLRQETTFPYSDVTRLVVTKGSGRFVLMVRYPQWVKEGAFKVTVNGKPVSYQAKPSSYIPIAANWKTGDKVEIQMPMENRVESLPNVPHYVAFFHGPILLGAKTGTSGLRGLVADDSRWGHIASGEKLPVDKAPVIIANDLRTLGEKLEPVPGKPLTFSISALQVKYPEKLELVPFFAIHDARYMMYWMTFSEEKYKSHLDELAALEKERLALDSRTIDFVAPGEQQPEVDHAMQSERSSTGNFLDQFFRNARGGGFFSYKMATGSETGLSLMVRYWGGDAGNRSFELYIDDQKLPIESVAEPPSEAKFVYVTYPIPDEMVRNKTHIRVKFQATQGQSAGSVYYIRLVRK